jgi:hypothetical protein
MEAIMKESVTTKSQFRKYEKRYIENGRNYRFVVRIRYDDECNNGHNSFSITGTIDEFERGRWRDYMGGCIHEEIEKHFPELAKYIKWHLCNSDGPMYYFENTLYHIENNKLDYARSTAIWPDATDEELKSINITVKLAERLPALMEEFIKAVEELGFVY